MKNSMFIVAMTNWTLNSNKYDSSKFIYNEKKFSKYLGMSHLCLLWQQWMHSYSNILQTTHFCHLVWYYNPLQCYVTMYAIYDYLLRRCCRHGWHLRLIVERYRCTQVLNDTGPNLPCAWFRILCCNQNAIHPHVNSSLLRVTSRSETFTSQ